MTDPGRTSEPLEHDAHQAERDEDPRACVDASERVLDRARRHLPALEAIFSAHPEALVIFGPDGEVRRINPAARELFQVAEGEGASTYGERMSALSPIDTNGEPLQLEDLPSRRVLRGERVRGFVMAVRSPHGRAWLSVSAVPLHGPDGEISGAVASSVDITNLRLLEDEREQVIRSLTHDARTRLNVIRAHGELLGRVALEEEDVRRRAALIVESSRRLADIIDALVGGR